MADIPIRIIVFNVIQLAACLYALRRGGAPERWTAWLMAGAAVATALQPYRVGRSFYGVEWPVLMIDTAMLLGLVALAARADRFWPLWIAALQLIAIGIHGVRAIDATILPRVYNRAESRIAYGMIVLLVIGTWRHWRRKAAGAEDRDWSPLVWW